MTGTKNAGAPHQHTLAILLPALLTAALWILWPGITGPFLFDDFPNLQNLRELGDSFNRESIGRYLAAWQGNPGRPLAALSFLIEDHAWPTGPEAFKRNNLLWHLLVGLGIFALTRRLARLALGQHVTPAQPVARLRPKAVSREPEDPDNAATPIPALRSASSRATEFSSHTTHTVAADWIALAVLALWLLHPMQLSATMLVVQRMTIFSNGLMVAGLLLYMRLVCDTNPGFSLRFKPGYGSGRRSAPGYREAVLGLAALAGFGALAFLAKENGPLIFAYATALNLTLLAPALARFPTPPRRLLWAGTLGMTLLLIAALLWQVRDPTTAFAGRDFSLTERLLSQARIAWEYLHGIVLPRLGGGGIYHDDFEVSRGLLQPWTTLPALLGVIAALGLAVWARRRFPLAAFAVLWFAAGHLIESTVIPLEMYFEHRNYLAMLGPLLALTLWLARAPGDLKWPLRVVLAAWVGLTASLSHQSARTWGDELTLAEVWVRERPRSVRAWQLLASAYVKRGDYGFARNVLLNAQETLPQADEIAFQLASLDCIAGWATAESVEALIEHARTARWERVVPDAVMHLRGEVISPRCREALTPDRYHRLVEALLANPDYGRRRDAVAHLYHELAHMYLDTGQPAEAVPVLAASFGARPDPQVAINAAQVLLYLHQPGEAMRALDYAEQAPQPAFKRWLYDHGDQIARLRYAARRLEARRQSLDD